ncbi:MAG: ATP-binding cassette domain-containing protein [Pseudomonadota bacterium]
MSDTVATLPASTNAPIRTGRLTRVQWSGLILLAAIAGAAAIGPLLSPYGANEAVCPPFATPSQNHPLGCNDVGQDLLTGILAGGRVSLAVGLGVAIIATLTATLFAITIATRGGIADLFAMRAVDAVMALPFLPLVIVLGAFFGGSALTSVAILSLVLWAHPVRELRAQALQLRRADFVDAARAMGASPWRIATRHIFPELAPLIVPQFVRIAHAAILTESSLSFLGLGDPILKSWGTILFHANARTAFLTDAWLWWIFPPGLLIAVTVLALALIGHAFGARAGEGSDAATPVTGPRAPRTTDAPLEIASATIAYNRRPAVHDASLHVPAGTTLGLVGQSGSGKSTLATGVLRLLPPGATIDAGSVHVGDADISDTPPRALKTLRGQCVVLVPQSAMNALNPVRTIKAQIREALRLHASGSAGDDRVDALLAAVKLPTQRANAYPHELSGGMRQRAVIAIALANAPSVLIADEPTTGLDVLVQADIMALLKTLQTDLALTVLFVTHDLPLIAKSAQSLAVCQGGRIVERGTPQSLGKSGQHPHTRELFENAPALRAQKLWRRPPSHGPAVLSLTDSSLIYGTGTAAKLLGRPRVAALQGATLTVRAGEVMGLVGGSGAGKTSLAKLALGLAKPTSGTVLLDGETPKPGAIAHMVFQDPYQSMRPGARVADVVAEPLAIRGAQKDENGRLAHALTAVHLPATEDFLHRRMASLSGGQRQRVAFARAMVTTPRLILADEPTSMLDQSLRAGLLALMETLRKEAGVAFLFITHDLVLARHFCDRIAVMQEGRIVEEGEADNVALTPSHPYTQALMRAAEF